MEGWEYCVDPNATDSVNPDSTVPSLTETDLLDRCVGDWYVCLHLACLSNHPCESQRLDF